MIDHDTYKLGLDEPELPYCTWQEYRAMKELCERLHAQSQAHLPLELIDPFTALVEEVEDWLDEADDRGVPQPADDPDEESR